MAIIAKEGGTRETHIAPAGTHQAVCYDVYDLGLQVKEFNGEKKIQPKIMIAWEINETIPSGDYAGKRYAVYKPYTLSLHEKSTLRKDLESWRGAAFTKDELAGFDIESLIGINAMISIVHNSVGDKTYANVSSVSKMMKGMTPLEPENKRSIPAWIKKIQDKAVVDEEIVSEAVEEVEPIPF